MFIIREAAVDGVDGAMNGKRRVTTGSGTEPYGYKDRHIIGGGEYRNPGNGRTIGGSSGGYQNPGNGRTVGGARPTTGSGAAQRPVTGSPQPATPLPPARPTTGGGCACQRCHH